MPSFIPNGQETIHKCNRKRFKLSRNNSWSSTRTLTRTSAILHEHLEWQEFINSQLTKLNRAAGLLSKIRHYFPKFLLRTIYFSIFNSHLIYTCQIWGQKESTIKKLSEIQDKAIRIISFKDKNYPTNELYCNKKILKIADYIELLNCLFVKSILLNNHLPIFENLFKKASAAHSYSTGHATKNAVLLSQPQTDHYGKCPMTYQAASTWNNLQNKVDILNFSINCN